jgi:hypothetical protein
MALMNWYDADFVFLSTMFSAGEAGAMDEWSRRHGCGIRVFKAQELTLKDYAHYVTVVPGDRYGPFDPDDSEEQFLRRLKAMGSFSVFAHPCAADWERIPELHAKGLVDAVQWPCRDVEHGRRRYREMEARGVSLPVVGGIDVHMLTSWYADEPVLFQGDVDAGKQVEGFPLLTLAIADSCEREALLDAVRAGRSANLHMGTWELDGPAPTVRALREGGIVERLQERRALRARIALRALDPSGTRLELAMPGGAPHGQLRYPAPGGEAREEAVPGATREVALAPPRLGLRHEEFQPVSLALGEGFGKVFAVRASWPIKAGLSPQVSAAGAAISLHLENASRRPQAGKARLSGAFWQAPPDLGWALPPGSSREWSFPVDGKGLEGRDLPVDLAVDFEGGGRGLLSRELGLAACLRAEGDAPWKHHAWSLKLDGPDHVVAPFSHYRGPDDLSAEVSLWWDDLRWYVYAVVTDDVHHISDPACPSLNPDPSKTLPGVEMFLNDSLEIGLDPGNTKREAYGDVYNLTAGFDRTGVPRVNTFAVPVAKRGAVNSEDWRREAHVDGARLAVERDEAARRTTYKLAIPFASLPPWSPAGRRPFGFSFCVDDNDRDGYGRKYRYWGGNTTLKTPSMWGTIHFLE